MPVASEPAVVDRPVQSVLLADFIHGEMSLQNFHRDPEFEVLVVGPFGFSLGRGFQLGFHGN